MTKDIAERLAAMLASGDTKGQEYKVVESGREWAVVIVDKNGKAKWSLE